MTEISESPFRPTIGGNYDSSFLRAIEHFHEDYPFSEQLFS